MTISGAAAGPGGKGGGKGVTNRAKTAGKNVTFGKPQQQNGNGNGNTNGQKQPLTWKRWLLEGACLRKKKTGLRYQQREETYDTYRKGTNAASGAFKRKKDALEYADLHPILRTMMRMCRRKRKVDIHSTIL